MNMTNSEIKTSIIVHKNQLQECINTQLNTVIRIQVLGYFKSLVGRHRAGKKCHISNSQKVFFFEDLWGTQPNLENNKLVVV